MFTKDDLLKAVDQGVLERQQVEAFLGYIEQRDGVAIRDREYLRFVSSFNDLFVIAACVLALMGIVLWMREYSTWVIGTALMIISWGLAELFSRRRRMAAPSILLHLVWWFACILVLNAFISATDIDTFWTRILSWSNVVFWEYVFLLLCAAILCLLHWLRFKVPIAAATVYSNISLAGIITLMMLFSTELSLVRWYFFIIGAMAFLIACCFDIKDNIRNTVWSDMAFWMHLLAAFFVTQPVMYWAGFEKIIDGQFSMVTIIAIFVVYMVACLISLLINRRALIIACIGYAVYTLYSVIEHYNLVVSAYAASFFFVGLSMLVLSFYWQWCRRFVYDYCPQSLRQYLPG